MFVTKAYIFVRPKWIAFHESLDNYQSNDKILIN